MIFDGTPEQCETARIRGFANSLKEGQGSG